MGSAFQRFTTQEFDSAHDEDRGRTEAGLFDLGLTSVFLLLNGSGAFVLISENRFDLELYHRNHRRKNPGVSFTGARSPSSQFGEFARRTLIPCRSYP